MSKDSDFGAALPVWPPPKVIWLGVGNQPTRPIADLLRASAELIARCNADRDDALLVLPGVAQKGDRKTPAQSGGPGGDRTHDRAIMSPTSAVHLMLDGALTWCSV